MKQKAAQNYLKALRKKSGLSQQEIAKLLGYMHKGQISRHERSASVPPLKMALAYELIFRVPIAMIFAGMHEGIRRIVEDRLRGLEAALGNCSAKDPNANLVAQKLTWLSKIRTRE